MGQLKTHHFGKVYDHFIYKNYYNQCGKHWFFIALLISVIVDNLLQSKKNSKYESLGGAFDTLTKVAQVHQTPK